MATTSPTPSPPAPTAGRAGAPILLTESPTLLGLNTGAWLEAECPIISTIRAIGGQAAVATSVLEHAETHAEACHAGTETEQTYMVAPMEAVQADVGSRFDAEVIGRYDDAAFTGPVDVAVFPCAYTDVTGRDRDYFQDGDGDQAADFRGDSDGSSAAIVDLNGEPVGPAGYVADATPQGGTLEIGLRAESPDCVVVAVWDDVDGDAQLDVDANGEPTEPYGVTEISSG